MYRLLIVDDEPAIVKGLYKIFQEESKYEFEIYKAYDARDAIEIVEKVKVDIMLSDIHMPGQDGFVLATKVKQKWPECRIIFLTGYNEFEYIYKAINKIKAGYLLKSEDDTEILEKIEKVVEEIEQIKKEQLIAFQKLLEDKQCERFVKNKCLESMVLQSMQTKEWSQLGEKLEIDLDGEITLYIGKLMHREECISRVAEKVYEIKKLYKQGLKEEFYIEIFEYQSEYIVCLIQPKRMMNLRQKLMHISEEYQKMIMSLFEQPFSVIFSKEPIKAEVIQETFCRLYSVIEKEKELEVPKILEEDQVELENEDPSSNKLIAKLESYIEANIGQELTLTKLANVIHLNPSYLSRYYRKMTGRNLSDFIKQIKLEKSKVLLLKTNKKIGEIATELGFESSSYFCKVFKNCVGISPVEFRREK